MTDKEQQERELEDARRQLVILCNLNTMRGNGEFDALIAQFRRIDAAEQAEKAAGKKGGRPPDKYPSPAAQAKRMQRAARKAGSTHRTPSNKKGRE